MDTFTKSLLAAQIALAGAVAVAVAQDDESYATYITEETMAGGPRTSWSRSPNCQPQHRQVKPLCRNYPSGSS